MTRYIKKKGNVKVNTDPEAPYSDPKGTDEEIEELLRRGWVKNKKTSPYSGKGPAPA